jgi:hypothetical protein
VDADPVLEGGRRIGGRDPVRPLRLKRTYRMIIRRVEALADGQRLLPGVGYLHFAFITDARATCWSWKPTTASTPWSRA